MGTEPGTDDQKGEGESGSALPSFYTTYCPACDLCGQELTHPPILLPVAAPVAKFIDDDKPPILEYLQDSRPAAVCRMCLMEAIAPIDKPLEGNPDAGWWHRMWVKGDFEPKGVA